MGSKRRRLALSCVDCRRRKVKCDRSYPSCVRCQKAGHADSCSYETPEERTNTALPTPTDDDNDDDSHGRREDSVYTWKEDAETWQKRASNLESTQNVQASQKSIPSKRPPPEKIILDLQDRVLELESNAKSASGRPVGVDKTLTTGRRLASAVRDDFQEDKRSMLRGSGFKTKYFGPSQPWSLVLQFPELAESISKTYSHFPSKKTVKQEMKKVRRENKQEIHYDGEPSRDTLISLIPPRDRLDRLIEGYMDFIETTYRVFHVPTFLRQYELFWQLPDEVSNAFLVHLLLVSATMNIAIADGPPVFVARSTVGRETAFKWTHAGQAWLDAQSRKHTTLATFQTQVLLVMAKRINFIKAKREWTDAGHLLRVAMASGLHREPSILSQKISLYDQEMRRRLWYTIVELELQAASNIGMPPALYALDYDVLAPLNVSDESFGEATKSMPTNKPLTEITRTTFLCTAQSHLPLRLEMLAQFNCVRSSLSYDLAMTYDTKLKKILAEMPSWSDETTGSVASKLSRLLIHEYITLVHLPFITQSAIQCNRFYSQISIRNAALKIMKTYIDLPLSDFLPLHSLREDLLRAALLNCKDVLASHDSKDDMVYNESMSVTLMESTVKLMQDTIRHVGQGFHPYWICSSALNLIRSKLSPNIPLDHFSQQAADNVISMHKEFSNVQGKSQNQNSSTGETIETSENEPKINLYQPEESILPPFNPFSPLDSIGDFFFDFDMADLWNFSTSNYT